MSEVDLDAGIERLSALALSWRLSAEHLQEEVDRLVGELARCENEVQLLRAREAALRSLCERQRGGLRTWKDSLRKLEEVWACALGLHAEMAARDRLKEAERALLGLAEQGAAEPVPGEGGVPEPTPEDDPALGGLLRRAAVDAGRLAPETPEQVAALDGLSTAERIRRIASLAERLAEADAALRAAGEALDTARAELNAIQVNATRLEPGNASHRGGIINAHAFAALLKIREATALPALRRALGAEPQGEEG